MLPETPVTNVASICTFAEVALTARDRNRVQSPVRRRLLACGPPRVA
jgi:hypothetical protein